MNFFTDIRRLLDHLSRAVLACLYLALFVSAVFFPWSGVVESLFHDYEADLAPPLAPHAMEQYQYIRSHLDEPFEDYPPSQVFIWPFKAVALSNMASGIMNMYTLRPGMREELVPLIEEIARRALTRQVSMYGFDPREMKDLGSQGMYLSHLNLILGIYRRITEDSRYDTFYTRVTKHLSDGCVSDSTFHIQSFSFPMKWPADQTVTLCSLYLYDRNFGTHHSDTPISGWMDYMKRHATDAATGLPWSEVTENWWGKIPRGCAMSWSCMYMAQFAPEEAAVLYRNYRARYFKTILGLGGFREYPPGADLGWNVDAGPVVMDIGLAASGIGVGPTRLFRDTFAHVALMRTASAIGMPHYSSGRRSHWLAPFLGEAMLFNGQTATRWFGDIPRSDLGDEAPFPRGALLLAVIYLVVIAFSGWRLFRLLRGNIRSLLPEMK